MGRGRLSPNDNRFFIKKMRQEDEQNFSSAERKELLGQKPLPGKNILQEQKGNQYILR